MLNSIWSFFLGLPIYFQIALALVVGVPIYLILGKIGRWLIRVIFAIFVIIGEFDIAKFKKTYNDAKDAEQWLEKIFWPALLIAVILILIVVIIYRIFWFLWQLLKLFWEFLKDCWRCLKWWGKNIWKLLKMYWQFIKWCWK